MTNESNDLELLTKKLEIDNEQYKENVKKENLKRENFGYKCKGKGHTVFDACSPEEIQLFLEYYEDVPSSVKGNPCNDVCNQTLNQQSLLLPLSSLLTQFVLSYSDREGKQNQELLSSICFIPQRYQVPDSNENNISIEHKPYFRMKRSILSSKSRLLSFASLHDDLSESELDIAKNCVLPALYIPQYELCITGLCSVLRYLLQHSHHVEGQNSPLLGFQNACLSAPAEVSLWTRFCEIDLPEATMWMQNVTIESLLDKTFHLPEEFAKFEMHLRQPIRMFNIRKRMQKAQKENEFSRDDDQKAVKNKKNESDAIKKFALTQHVYAEGPDCLLSDIVLFLHYYLSFYASKLTIDIVKWEHIIPRTIAWFKKVGELGAFEVAQSLIYSEDKSININSLELTLPSVPEQSLYKSDPKRHNTASRVFTRSNKVERAINNFDESNLSVITPDDVNSLLADKLKHAIDWTAYPPLVSPLEGGKLPPERAIKKCQQLENLALSVLQLVRTREQSTPIKIVDFCSGGGHLAILLAYLLPKSIIYLVENKPESLERALKRVQELQLKNCRFFQGNLDYFRGNFDIGVSLHACGVATDLVINMCIKHKADFVCCPCCYGSLQENHVLTYPRSQYYRNQKFAFEDYMVIGHTADQTHVTNDKHAQGEAGMNIIDTDRIYLAKENGYHDVKLLKLEPTSCTPKNNVIVAKY